MQSDMYTVKVVLVANLFEGCDLNEVICNF